MAAVLALIILGVGSLFLTWRNIQHQRAIVDDHLMLSSRVIITGIEANLVRTARGMDDGTGQASSPLFSPMARDLFRELMSSGEVSFVGLFGPQGRLLISPEGEDGEMGMPLPPPAQQSLAQGKPWHGMINFGGKLVMVSAQQARPELSRIWDAHHMGSDDDEFPDLPALFIVIGLSAEKHLSQFQQYRRAALYQTGYVFLAAIVLWTLAFAYLQRREQSRRLIHLEQFQSRLLDNMPDGLVSVGADGEILAANGSARRLLGGENGHRENDGKGVMGRRWDEFPFAPLLDNDEEEWVQYTYNDRNLEMLAIAYEDEEDFDDEGRRLVLIRDRTRIKTLEEDLNEAQRLATIGTLAAGVAHEVRNPLSSLRGFAQLLAEKLRGQEPLNTYASTMVQEADRLNRVVTDLLYLSRPREFVPEDIDLDKFLDGLDRLLQFDMRSKHIRLEYALEAHLVYADPDGFKQVLLNLIANALDAIPEHGGRIVISSEQRRNGVWLAVTDNGAGMPEDVKRHALEPFFTAKPKGTGLGLAIVNNIMRAHKGRIAIDTGQERGTRINIFFPRDGGED